MPAQVGVVGLQPSSSIPRSLLSVATSLCQRDSHLPGLHIVGPKRALKNGIAVISQASSNLNTITTILCGFGSLGLGFYLYVWKSTPVRNAVRWLGSKFTASVSIASTHPLNKDVLVYLEQKGLNRSAMSLALVNPNMPQSIHELLPTFYPPSHSLPTKRDKTKPEPESADQEALEYVPTCGSYVFWHDGHRMSVNRLEEVTGYYRDDGTFIRTQNGPTDLSRGQTLTITCWSLGTGVQPIKDFLEHVRQASKPSKLNTTTIFRASCVRDTQKFNWDSGVTRPARKVDSIALEGWKKKSLLKECTRYFSKEDEEFHASRGIPYRRGLLFYGPPGTGKTSFTVALAGHFKVNVYMISMSDDALNDRGLGKLFDSLPRRCIVLLEDIDSSGIDREPQTIRVPPKPMLPKDPNAPVMNPPVKTVVVGCTLSGLLNVLDGPASVDGRLVVMTSNSPDALDAALLRPGRIDSKILFGYTNREISSQLFKHIFVKSADEIRAHSEDPDSNNDHETAPWPSVDTIDHMADSFATSVPETRISPAEVQGYLMRHRDDPYAALNHALPWALEIVDVKEKGKNVASFDNEIKRGGAVFGRASPAPPPYGNAVPYPAGVYGMAMRPNFGAPNGGVQAGDGDSDADGPAPPSLPSLPNRLAQRHRSGSAVEGVNGETRRGGSGEVNGGAEQEVNRNL